MGKFLLEKSLSDTIITICPLIADSPNMAPTKVDNVIELLRIPSPIAETILSLLDTDSFLTFRHLSKECNEIWWENVKVCRPHKSLVNVMLHQAAKGGLDQMVHRLLATGSID